MATPLVMALIDPFNADAWQPFLLRRCDSPWSLTRPAYGSARLQAGRNIWAIEGALLAAFRELHGQVVGLLDGDG